MTFYIILSFIIYIGITAGLFGIFRKAKVKLPWAAFIPLWNLYLMLRIMGKSLGWLVLLMIPFFNIITLIILFVDLAKCMGKDSLGWQIFVSLFPFIALPVLGFHPGIHYLGSVREASLKLPKKSATQEIWELVIFTLVVAWVLRTFMIEPFNIPTGSMERTLRVGDFLFVSKIHYGPRIPMTPLAFPLAHNQLPIIGGKPYSTLLSLPYMRLPALESIEPGEIIVFNYPMQDEHPPDKRDHYIKRCVATPGDTFQIIKGQTYLNGKVLPTPSSAQLSYYIVTDGSFSYHQLFKKLGIRRADYLAMPSGNLLILTTPIIINQIKHQPGVLEVQQVLDTVRWNPNLFPHHSRFQWNLDNYGPIYIPKRGDTLILNDSTYHLYKRMIEVYENAGRLTLTSDGKVLLNNQPITHYITKMGYYFALGDNRHNSLDSRFWGFIPEDHIVGKPIVVWFSWDKEKTSPRWNRIFWWIPDQIK